MTVTNVAVGDRIRTSDQVHTLPTGTLMVDDAGTSYRVAFNIGMGRHLVSQNRHGQIIDISTLRPADQVQSDTLPYGLNYEKFNLVIVWLPTEATTTA